MDLTELIDYYILPRLSPRTIKFVARNSWGRPRNLRTRLAIRALELALSAYMPKPELMHERDEDGDMIAVYPVRYRRHDLRIIPMYGIRCERVFVLFDTVCYLLKKR